MRKRPENGDRLREDCDGDGLDRAVDADLAVAVVAVAAAYTRNCNWEWVAYSDRTRVPEERKGADTVAKK